MTDPATVPCPFCSRLRPAGPCPVCADGGRIPEGEEAQRIRAARQGILDALAGLAGRANGERDQLLTQLDALYALDDALQQAVEELWRELES